MKNNYQIALVGEKVTLVPYRPEHVPKYHEWMKDPDLLEATGSEPLSFEEEVAMQESWRVDPNKCTFIVHSTPDSSRLPDTYSVQENLPHMIGDVNLFLSEIDEDEEDEPNLNSTTVAPTDQPPRIQAEVDIMIAEKSFQHGGLGKTATCAMMLYGAQNLQIQRFFCKINDGNEGSIRLFKSLGFVQCDYAACFKQYEFELVLSLKELKSLLEPYGSYKVLPCPMEEGEANSETVL
eukprot:Nitzschia sp. Nitz4//scaffold3_size479765//203314//204095//NITZ4_000085-RA/size479765-augustus-gene-1.596-mRNA-1//-1//CDS//3329550713//6157//frame0